MANEWTPPETGLARTVKPRGKAKRHTSAELDAMTSPDALREKLEQARQDWQEKAPRDFKNLLDAKS